MVIQPNITDLRGLPSAYQQVEWIGSSGTQRIDTGVVRDKANNYRICADILYEDVSTRQLNGAQGFTYYGVVDGYWQVAKPSREYVPIEATPNVFSAIDISFLCKIYRCRSYINGQSEEHLISYENNPVGAHFHIFSLNGGTLPSSCKVSRFELYQNDALLRHFIPCYRKSDSVIGMYDIANGVFYTNSGTGVFAKGNDIY